MWMMLQQDTADDFVLATGVTHTIRSLVEKTFATQVCTGLFARTLSNVAFSFGISTHVSHYSVLFSQTQRIVVYLQICESNLQGITITWKGRGIDETGIDKATGRTLGIKRGFPSVALAIASCLPFYFFLLRTFFPLKEK
jgi:hypothetical protein